MNFDFDSIEMATFGVCTRLRSAIEFLDVPINRSVIPMLREMAENTWESLQEVHDAPALYEPSNDSTGLQHIAVPIDDEQVALFRDVNEADRFNPGGELLVQTPRRVSSYFARFTDQAGARLTGMRQSTDFKGVLRHKGRLMRMFNDTLEMTEDDIFRLDTVFDMLIASDEVRILRPAGFEVMGQLQQTIKDAVPRNVEELQQSLPFVEFGLIEGLASANVGAARLLASIRARGTDGITANSLQQACTDNGVAVGLVEGRLHVEEEALFGFLRTLDRRRYNTELIPGQREVYEASNRRRV